MKSIAGVICFDGAAAAPLLQRLTAAMPGGGAARHWSGGPIALGHCLITAGMAEQEHQQLVRDAEGDVTLVFQGRIDNRDQLLRDLGGRAAYDSDLADAQLVLMVYRRWGLQAPAHLVGDFAYCVWDGPRKQAFCSADRIGACPLYYAITEQLFAFASTEEALLGLEQISREPCEELVAQLFVPELTPPAPTQSWLKRVSVLGPGQTLTIGRDGGQRVATYWHWQPGELLRFRSEQEAQEAFREVFGAAVRCRVPPDRGVAQMLSGGMDSAAIRAVLAEIVPSLSLHTFSAVSDDRSSCVETSAIEALAVGARAHFTAVPSFTGFAGVEDLLDVCWTAAHPVDNSILLPGLMCLGAARQGHSVMLTGVTGDVAMRSPERYIADLLREMEFGQAVAESVRATRQHTYLRGVSPFKLLLLNGWTAAAPGRLKAMVRARRSTPAGEDAALLNPHFRRRMNIDARLGEQDSAEVASRQGGPGDRQAEHIAVLSGPRGPVLGLHGYARVASRYGVELRDPWADWRVLDFFLRLPTRYKVHRGWTKYLARTAFSTLPGEVRWRAGKEHLGWQFTRRVLTESRDVIAQCCERDFQFIEEYVELNAARQLGLRYLRDANAVSPQRQDTLYGLLVLAQWVRRTGSSARPTAHHPAMQDAHACARTAFVP